MLSVSVLMTTFNREKYIAEAIQSVLNSTFKDFELIIVDDCSTDRTVEIANIYKKKDSRIKVFENENNLGDYPNRNQAAAYARGKYIKYVDADDYIYPNGLEIIVNQMDSYPDAALGIFSLPQDLVKPFPVFLNPDEIYSYNFFGPGLFHKAPLSVIFKKDSFDAVGGFKADRMTSDFEMWHRMAQKYNFLLIQDHIVWYRIHDSQEANSINAYELASSKIENYYIWDINSPLSRAQRKLIQSKKLKLHLKYFLIGMLKFDIHVVLINLRKLFIYYKIKK